MCKCSEDLTQTVSAERAAALRKKCLNLPKKTGCDASLDDALKHAAKTRKTSAQTEFLSV